jgi:hypothetical protein
MMLSASQKKTLVVLVVAVLAIIGSLSLYFAFSSVSGKESSDPSASAQNRKIQYNPLSDDTSVDGSSELNGDTIATGLEKSQVRKNDHESSSGDGSD